MNLIKDVIHESDKEMQSMNLLKRCNPFRMSTYSERSLDEIALVRDRFINSRQHRAAGSRGVWLAVTTACHLTTQSCRKPWCLAGSYDSVSLNNTELQEAAVAGWQLRQRVT